MVHLPPDPHIIESFANANLSSWKALAEMVDNSLDAGATRVVIDVTDRVLTVTDDGAGCEDITAMFKLGHHKRRKSAKKSLGRYGVGVKDAWLSFSDTMEVVSCRGHVKTSMKVNYKEWMNNNWNVADPECEGCNESSGTTIRMPLRNGKNAPTDDAFNMLAFVFTPALRRGIQIVRSSNKKRMLLQATEMPSRNDVVQSEFEIDGKSVKIDIGILPDGVTVERGPFWLIYDHRIIEATSIGAKQYSVRRIAGTITIGEGWVLSKNKDVLSESQDRLGDEIFERIKHVLKKADEAAELMESSALRGELQHILNTSIGEANKLKEKRDRGDSVGSVSPKNTGRKRKTASKTQDGLGSVIGLGKNSTRGGFIVDWCEIDPSISGTFDRSGMRVSLNLNNSGVSQAKASCNRLALTISAYALIADFSCRHNEKGQALLQFSFDDFAQALGLLMNGYSERKHNVKAAV